MGRRGGLASGTRNGLTGQAKRDACVAYIWIDITVRHDAGAMSDQAYSNQKMRILNELYTTRGSMVPRGTVNRIQKAGDAILAEDPSVEEVAGQADVCRSFLRL